MPRKGGVSEVGGEGLRLWEKMKEKFAWGTDNWELVKEGEREMNC